MKPLVLQFDTEQITMDMQDTRADVLKAVAGRNAKIEDDPEVNATYIELIDDGVDIVVKNGKLSSVFLFLDPVSPRSDRFVGQCNYLDESFFAKPNEAAFEQALSAQGFGKSSRVYPNAIDYMSTTMRVRYERRDNKTMILFDSGDRLRAAGVYPEGQNIS